jgi:hypothetical protein
MNIREIVKDNVVRFVKYRQGYVFYRVRVPGENIDRTFPVPLADVGNATLPAADQAIEFMRYIRKAIEDGTFVSQHDAPSPQPSPGTGRGRFRREQSREALIFAPSPGTARERLSR